MNQIQVGSIEHEELLLKTKEWKVVYPLYFDKIVSRADGRKVPTKLSVEKPDVEDLAQMMMYYKLPMVVEINKRHPRDHFTLGRVRYNLKNEDGTWANEEIQNSKL
jgi:signal recognition particle subunit SRP19